MDVRDNSTSGDGGLDQGVQLLVSPDGELKMPWRDPLHLEVLGGVSGQLQNLGGEVLEDGSRVDGGGGADAHGDAAAGSDAVHHAPQPPLGALRPADAAGAADTADAAGAGGMGVVRILGRYRNFSV